jgi:hypothetical protein
VAKNLEEGDNNKVFLFASLIVGFHTQLSQFRNSSKKNKQKQKRIHTIMKILLWAVIATLALASSTQEHVNDAEPSPFNPGEYDYGDDFDPETLHHTDEKHALRGLGSCCAPGGTATNRPVVPAAPPKDSNGIPGGGKKVTVRARAPNIVTRGANGCVPRNQIQSIVNHPNTDQGCRPGGTCAGRCRVFWWLICDPKGVYNGHLPYAC